MPLEKTERKMGLLDLFKKKKFDETDLKSITYKRYWLDSISTILIPTDWEVTNTDRFLAKSADDRAILTVMSSEEPVKGEINKAFFERLKGDFFKEYERDGFTALDETTANERYISKTFRTYDEVEYHFTCAKKIDDKAIITEIILRHKDSYSLEMRELVDKIGMSIQYVPDFTRLFAQRLVTKNPNVQVRKTKGLEIEWMLKSEPGQLITSFLDNAYAEYMHRSDFYLSEIIEKYASSILETIPKQKPKPQPEKPKPQPEKPKETAKKEEPVIITTPPPAQPPKPKEEAPKPKEETPKAPAAQQPVQPVEKPVETPADKTPKPVEKPIEPPVVETPKAAEKQEKAPHFPDVEAFTRGEKPAVETPAPQVAKSVEVAKPVTAPILGTSVEAPEEIDEMVIGGIVIKKEEIFPLVRTTGFIEELKAEIPDLLYENINSELGVIYLVRDEKISLTMGDLRNLHLDMLALKSLAVQNLINQIEVGVEEEGNRYTIVADGKFEASFLVVSDLWSKDNIPVEGTITVGVPANNVLLITGSANPNDMNWIRHRVAQAYVESNIPISDKLFEVKGNSLIPL
ncbi:PF07285 family protein [Capnocytophaga sp. CM59]|nr:PF07285 family protein [Capnocytophaga sp. CM59]